ncbi:MAG: 3-keto-5-aminohexanoate cleavage protein [Desulfobacteraceae bacterium]|nr:MAG: 3-keto-5-aminohexanoate cleavage protein [Desulfobacteraceae bacterium]
MQKLIITLAMLGNVPTKKLNPSTPSTPTEICDVLEECCALGVTVAHIHARDEHEAPTHSRASYKAILDEIEARGIEVITQLSTGARGGENTVESRGQMLDLKCDMASLATGSSNFPSSVNHNSPQLIQEFARMMKKNGIKPEIEAFDTAMIDYARYLLGKGLLVEPAHFNLVLNVPGSIKGTPKNLLHMVESLPPGATWTVSAIGNSQVPMLAMAILMGGHARTGLEDVLEYEKGVPATNRMLVERVVRLAKELGREIAGVEEARKILCLDR